MYKIYYIDDKKNLQCQEMDIENTEFFCKHLILKVVNTQSNYTLPASVLNLKGIESYVYDTEFQDVDTLDFGYFVEAGKRGNIKLNSINELEITPNKYSALQSIFDGQFKIHPSTTATYKVEKRNNIGSLFVDFIAGEENKILRYYTKISYNAILNGCLIGLSNINILVNNNNNAKPYQKIFLLSSPIDNIDCASPIFEKDISQEDYYNTIISDVNINIRLDQEYNGIFQNGYIKYYFDWVIPVKERYYYLMQEIGVRGVCPVTVRPSIYRISY